MWSLALWFWIGWICLCTVALDNGMENAWSARATPARRCIMDLNSEFEGDAGAL